MAKKLGVAAALAVLIGAGIVWTQCGEAKSDTSATVESKSNTTKNGKRRVRKDAHTLPRASVAGTVTAKGGAAIAGAKVCAWATSKELAAQDRAEPTCVTTNAAGSYVIGKLLASTYWLGASAPKFLPARYGSDEQRDHDLKLEAGQRRDGADFLLVPGGVRVTGVVKDIGGGPIGDALVYNRGAVARSDAAGKFTMWVERGSVWLVGIAEGYSSAWTRVSAPTETAELLLTPESILEGRVVLASTGEPVADAMVEADRSRTVRTDSNGRFRLTRLKPGRYKPTASSDDLYGESAESVMLGIGETRSKVTIKLHAIDIIRGRVVIAGGDKPCPEPGVILRSDMDKTWGGARGKATENGHVEFSGVAKGTYKVVVRCKGYASQDKYPDLKVTSDKLATQVWSVDVGGSIAGVVKAFDGTPVAGVRLHARQKRSMGWNPNARGKTDADGKFELAGLNPGEHELTVTTSGYLSPKEPLAVTLAKGETKRVEVSLRQGGIVKGTVVDKAGKPQSGLTVWVAKSRWRSSSATTATDGSFELKGVDVGSHDIMAKRGRRSFGNSGAKAASTSATVVVGETVQVKLVVESSEGTITGKVVDPSGKPVADAFVRAVAETGKSGYNSAAQQVRRRWGGNPVAAQTDGTFEVKNLAPGKYLVRAYRKGGGEALAKHVTVGADITMTMERTVTISGEVTTTSGDSIERFKISVTERKSEFSRDESFFLTGGKWKISDLPAGEYVVRATASEGEATQTIKIGAGDSKDKVDFQLQGLAIVEGYAHVLGSGAVAAKLRVFAMPVEGGGQDAMARSFRQNVTTDDKGFFRLSSVAPGKVMLMLWSMGGDYYGGAALVEAVSGQTVTAKVAIVPAYAAKGDPKGTLGFEVDAPMSSMMSNIKPFDVLVKSVAPGGAAEAAGLRKGDIIVAIEGLDVTGYNAVRWAFFMRGVPKGKSLNCKLKRGPTLKITAR